MIESRFPRVSRQELDADLGTGNQLERHLSLLTTSRARAELFFITQKTHDLPREVETGDQGILLFHIKKCGQHYKGIPFIHEQDT